MRVSLIGCGCGEESLSLEALAELSTAELVIGPERLLNGLPELPVARQERASRPEEIAERVRSADCDRVCVLLSGDSGFYSGARRLSELLTDAGEVTVLPGISSQQVLSARLKRPWQDWMLLSAHGTTCDVRAAVCRGKPVFFLTGGSNGPTEICRELCEAGLGQLSVTVGEELGTGRERIRTGTAEEMRDLKYAALNVLLAEAAPCPERRGPGLPDECFEREAGIPMTKQEVRAVALAKLAPKEDEVCWDIGTGSGSVAVELAHRAGAVWSVEEKPEALALAERNRRRHCAWNLRLVEGSAPEALESLPKPDAVFVGGSGEHLEEILQCIRSRNDRARICVPAVTLETVYTACRLLEAPGFRTEVTQLSVCRSKAAGGKHMMLAQNPVYLITGEPV